MGCRIFPPCRRRCGRGCGASPRRRSGRASRDAARERSRNGGETAPQRTAAHPARAGDFEATGAPLASFHGARRARFLSGAVQMCRSWRRSAKTLRPHRRAFRPDDGTGGFGGSPTFGARSRSGAAGDARRRRPLLERFCATKCRAGRLWKRPSTTAAICQTPVHLRADAIAGIWVAGDGIVDKIRRLAPTTNGAERRERGWKDRFAITAAMAEGEDALEAETGMGEPIRDFGRVRLSTLRIARGIYLSGLPMFDEGAHCCGRNNDRGAIAQSISPRAASRLSIVPTELRDMLAAPAIILRQRRIDRRLSSGAAKRRPAIRSRTAAQRLSLSRISKSAATVYEMSP